MRARSHIASSVSIIGISLAWGAWPSVAAAQPVIYSTRFVGMMPIGGTVNIPQTALKAGDKTFFQTDVHSPFGYPPIISADLSELGVSSPTTTPASPNSPNYDSNSFYTFGPFTIGSNIPSGSKTISVTATDGGGGVATTTVRVVVDNAPPTVTLSNITFSTTSPREGDLMYLSGSMDGTGTKIVLGSILGTLLDADKNERGPWPWHRAAYDPRQLIQDMFASSTESTFTNAPFRLSEGGVPGDISASSFLKVDFSVYDEAGNLASTSLTVPIPKTAPPDPCAVPGSCVSNVLFLPGIEGSRLYRLADGCDPGVPDCGDHKLWDPSSDSDLNDLGLDELGKSVHSDVYVKEGDIVASASAFGIIKKFYESFVAQMNGLKIGGTITDWKPVAYDWRLSLPDLLDKGTERGGKIFYGEATSTPYIEQTLRALAATSKTGKVSVVAHSNGGLLAKALIEKLGAVEAGNLIDDVIFVGVPQSGAPQAVGGLLFGYGQALPRDDCSQLFLIGSLCSSLASRAAARSLAEHSPMAYHLLPSDAYFASAQDPTRSVASFTGAHEYQKERKAYGATIDDFSELSDFLQAKEGGRTKPSPGDISSPGILSGTLLGYAKGEHDTLDPWVPPAGITLYQIAGWGVDTISGISFYENPKFFGLLGTTPEYRPVFVEDGDGVVPVPSALLMASSTNVKRYWVDLRSYYKVTKIKRSHADLFEISSLQDLIKNIIGDSTSTLPAYISSNQPSANSENKKLTFFLHSPLTLQLKDSSGNVTGLAEDGSITEDIPGATYGEFGEVKYLIAPAGAQYQLTMHGQSSGTFSLDMQESSGDVVTTSSTIANVPTTASTLASLTISGGFDSVSPLTVDEHGDGKDILTIVPKSGETVAYTVPAAPVVPDTGTSQPLESRPAGGPRSSSIPAGSISIPVITPVHIAPIVATTTSSTASTTPATTTPTALIAIASVPKLSAVTPRTPQHVSVVVPSTTPTIKVTNITPELSQTASVYEAHQPSILKKIGAAVYNGLHGFWISLLKLF
ncbi:MAG: lipase/acyltransferase domain-containing protein [Minisyncoccota bacterium]